MKHLQPTYWQRYDRVFKHFSSTTIYQKIRELARKLGKPFDKLSRRGPKFKIPPEEYAAYEAYQIIADNASFRDMELDAELFVDKHLDHSTFHGNFLKIPYEYFSRLLQSVARMLEQLLGYCIATLMDSTGLEYKAVQRNHD